MQDRACNICGNESDNKTHLFHEKMFGSLREYRYLECAACGCYQIDEEPEATEEYYPEDYYSFSDDSLSAFRRPIVRTLRVKRDRSALFGTGPIGLTLQRFRPANWLRFMVGLDLTESTSILDIGCGNGSFLYGFREMGFENLLGVDPFVPSDIRYANGLVVKKAQIEDVDGKWDVITVLHVLEHVPEPLAFMRSVASRLAPGGICVLRVPVVPNFAFDLYGEDWVALDVPRHVFTYSRAALAILADKSGLRITRTVCDSTAFQFWGSEQYKRGITLHEKRSYEVDRRKSIFTTAQIQAFSRKTRELNERDKGDQATFYLEHKASE